MTLRILHRLSRCAALPRPLTLPVLFVSIFFALSQHPVHAAPDAVPPSAAAPGPSAAKSITLSEAYAMALASHEDVLVAGEAALRARSEVGVATSSMLPTVTAEGRYTMYSEQQSSGSFIVQPDDATRVEVRVSQDLFTGGKNWAARREAMINAEGSRVSLASVKESIVLGTAGAYYGLLKAGSDVEIKEAAAKRTIERLRVATARYTVGEVTRAAVLRAEAEAAGAEAELISARSSSVDAQNRLRRFAGIEGPFTVEKPPVEGWTGMTLSDFLDLAYANRKDYRVSVLGNMAATEGVRRVRGEFFPSLRAEGVYEWRDQSPKTTFFQEESVSGALVLSYPIFEGLLRRSELSGARSAEREAELRRGALRRDIEVEVREAYNRLKTLEAVIDSLKKMVAFATEDYRMVFEQFKSGVASTVDVIDSDSNLVSAEMSLMNSTYDLEMAKLTLKASAGVILDTARATASAKGAAMPQELTDASGEPNNLKSLD